MSTFVTKNIAFFCVLLLLSTRVNKHNGCEGCANVWPLNVIMFTTYCSRTQVFSFNFQVKKEMLLDPEDLRQFQNHSSQMAALDFMVSVASNTFIPSYDGNMAKLVEGHRRYNDQFHKGFSSSFI